MMMNTITTILLILIFTTIIVSCVYAAPPLRSKEYFYLDNYPVIKDYVKQDNPEEGDLPAFLSADYPNPRVVEFYASWCPHCQHFKEHYIEFANQMDKLISGTSIKFEVFAVSCVPNRNICQKSAIRGYPTLKLYSANSVNGTIVQKDVLNAKKILNDVGLLEENYSEMSKPVMRIGDETHNTPHYAHFMHRTKKSTFDDAHLSLVFALRNSIFASQGVLPEDRKRALKDFLNLLQMTAPVSSSFQPLLKAILDDYEHATSSDIELNRILDKHPQPITSENSNNGNSQWSASCTQHGTGFTCGLWTLFHLITIGFVEWNEVAIGESQMLPTMMPAETIRNFIEHFFQCEECRVHFLKEYDSCGHDRCNRLTNDKKRNKDSWIQLPLWLFETHNGVNARLREERIERNEEDPPTKPQDVLFPPITFCPKCWLSEGRWDEEIVYSYLRLEYWPEDFNSQKFRNQLFGEASPPLDHRDLPGDKFQTPADVQLPTIPLGPSAVVIISLGAIVVWQRKRQYDLKGFHKKRESDLPS